MSFNLNRRTLMQGAAAGALILGAGVKPGFAQAKPGGHIRYGRGHGSTSDSLDPANWENGFVQGMGFALYNCLTEVGTDGSLVPELATEWEANEGASVWTFKLRQGVTFHDGAPLVAADVVASLGHHMGDDSESAAKVIVAVITSMDTPDDHTIVFNLEGGNADFPFILSDYHLPIGKAGDNGKVDWQTANGTGGYKLDSFEPGVRATMTKNANYWKEGRAHFDTVEMLSIIDPTARTNALLSGQVDVIDRVVANTAALFDSAPNIKLSSVAGNQHYVFPMDTRVGPFSDNNVRLAIKHAVNRQELVDKVLSGFGSIGNDHPIGRGQQYFAADLPQTSYDPDKAKWHLQQSGLDSIEVELSASEAAFGGAVDAALLIANSAAPAGININVIREPNDGYWSNVWMVKPWSASYWGGRPVEDQMLSTAYATGAAWNDSFWSNERFDKVLVEARAELDTDKRREMYAELQTLLNTDGGVVVPMFANYVVAMTTAVGHEEQMGSNMDMDSERSIERWWFV
ncbi:MAG: ABC transporter substrate-binding protein [Paracoccaceae bacterium]